MKKIMLTILTISLVILTSCVSSKNQVNISAAYSFEGRYGTDTEIRIDGKKINYQESVWVLSNKTLYNLLTSANPKKRNSLMLKNDFKKDNIQFFEVPSVKRDDIDDFCNEVYIWEKWTVSTNEVSF